MVRVPRTGGMRLVNTNAIPPDALEQDTEVGNDGIIGYVEQLDGTTMLRGWAMQRDNPRPLRIYVLGAECLIGEGTTGEARAIPAGTSGFAVPLSQRISLSDLVQRYVNVFAIGAAGEQCLLPIWQDIALVNSDPVLATAEQDGIKPADLTDEAAIGIEGFCDATAPEALSPGLVTGFVDRVEPSNVLHGWAVQEGNAELLPIYVFAETGLIGEGVTGEERKGLGNCGFTVKLTNPISVADLFCTRVVVYAVDPNGERHRLPIWDHIVEHPGEPALDMGPTDIDVPARASAIAAAKPYLTGGEVLSPACRASDLYSTVERGGLRGYLPHMTVPAVLDYLRDDHLPIPAPANREDYHFGDEVDYWLSGLDDFCKIIKETEQRTLRLGKILDFGGSTGRVSRHFLRHAKTSEIYACDAKRSSVEWCKRYFPPEYRVFLNSFIPTLPFSDNFFDLITSFSVFTHIDEFEDGWLLELSRILRPGGLAYVTIHDENTWECLDNREIVPQGLVDMLSASPDAHGVVLSGAMPFDRKAFSLVLEGHERCNVFHRSDYVKNSWGRYFEIENIHPFRHFLQAIVLMRKREP